MISVLDTRAEAGSKLTSLKLWRIVIDIHHIDDNLRDIRELTVITIHVYIDW